MNKIYITSPVFKYTSCKSETFLIPVLIGNLSQSIYYIMKLFLLLDKETNKQVAVYLVFLVINM